MLSMRLHADSMVDNSIGYPILGAYGRTICFVKQALSYPSAAKSRCADGRSRRDSKGITFIELNDGSRFKGMQLVVDAGVMPDERLEASDNRQQHLRHWRLGRVARKGTSRRAESCYDPRLRHRRPARIRCKRRDTPWSFCARSPTFACAATLSARCFACAMPFPRDPHFFSGARFLYVHTPIITTSDCEGAGQMFSVTTLNLQEAAAHRRR